MLKEGSTFDLSPRRDGGSKTIVLLFKSCFFKTSALDVNLREFVSFDRPFERGFSNIL